MKWHYIFWLYTGFIVLVLAGAYAGLIPTEIAVVPMYDSIGHFVLYGIWLYLLDRSLYSATVNIFHITLPKAFMILFPLVALEEFAQMFASTRTFSLVDLFWGFAGMCIFWLISLKR